MGLFRYGVDVVGWLTGIGHLHGGGPGLVGPVPSAAQLQAMLVGVAGVEFEHAVNIAEETTRATMAANSLGRTASSSRQASLISTYRAW